MEILLKNVPPDGNSCVLYDCKDCGLSGAPDCQEMADFLGKKKKETFDLGDTTYTPDFYLIKSDRFIEIKGWMKPESERKIDIFRKLYSNEELDILFRKDLIELRIEL